jgi:hypothetical protein
MTPMCYLCLRENPFDSKPEPTTTEKKKARLADIKAALKAAESHDRCTLGQVLERNMRAEQYKLSRDL